MPTIYRWTTPIVVDQDRYNRLITRQGYFATPTAVNTPSDTGTQTLNADLQDDVLTVGQYLLPRKEGVQHGLQMVSGIAYLGFFRADKDMTITKLTTFCGGTAAVATPTLCRVGLYREEANGDVTRIGITANDPTLWATAFTDYERNLLSAVDLKRGVRYAATAFIVTAVATPSLHGQQYGSTTQVSQMMGKSPRQFVSVAGLADLPTSMAAGSMVPNRLAYQIYMS